MICQNCGHPIEDYDQIHFPMYCIGCEDYINWQLEEQYRDESDLENEA